jgi:uncharacterized protein YccT (UPF0319 family)
MKKLLLLTGLLLLVFSGALWAQGTAAEPEEGDLLAVDSLAVEIRHCYS